MDAFNSNTHEGIYILYLPTTTLPAPLHNTFTQKKYRPTVILRFQREQRRNGSVPVNSVPFGLGLALDLVRE